MGKLSLACIATHAASFSAIALWLLLARGNATSSALASQANPSPATDAPAAGSTSTASPQPVELTANQDHKRLMELLGIDKIRPGRDGNNPKSDHYANYDESKANPYTDLPDPLVANDGTKITTPEQWWNVRRPEIVEYFDREIYGRVPAVTPKVIWEVTETTNENKYGVPALTKKLVGHVDNSACPAITVELQLTLTTPADATGAVPVVMEFGFIPRRPIGQANTAQGAAAQAGPAPNGPALTTPAVGALTTSNTSNSNTAISVGGSASAAATASGSNSAAATPSTATTSSASATDPSNGVANPPPRVPNSPPAFGPPWQEQVLKKGWAYASLIPTSAQADNGAGLTKGIIGLCNKGQPRALDDWGALRAWAWAASRAIDYFETDPAVDAKRVALEGHSRYGKATLVTMAYDPRLAVAFVSSSGEGGAKLHRRDWGEIVENIAGTGEYHWMAGNFIKYAGPLNWNDLPVDSHELIALCAPRPVFISAGTREAGDGWVDAKGSFLAAAAAGPVYKLLGKTDLGTTDFPPVGTTLISGDIAYRQHNAGHTPAPNWPTFLRFAERYFNQ
jgi:hypothetical protein